MGTQVKVGQVLSSEEIEDILARVRRGDEQAREKLFYFLQARFLTLAKLRVSETDAQDIVQETMIVLNEHVSEIETPGGLLAYTNEVMRNKIGNFYRRRGRMRNCTVNLDDTPEPAAHPGEELDALDLERVIWKAVDQLEVRRPRCREIFLGLIRGLDLEQICSRTQIPRARIDDRIYKCRRALKDILEQQYGIQI